MKTKPETRDIAERKMAEENIMQAAEEWNMPFDVIFDSIADLISIQDKDFRLIKMNKAYNNVFKMGAEKLFGKTCHEVVHRTKKPYPTCPHKKVLKTRKPLRTEFFEPRLGIYFEVNVSPIFNEKSEVVYTLHVARDITERKNSEEAFKGSEQKFKAIFDNAIDGILVVESETQKLLIGNKAMCQMLDYGPEEIKNLGITDIHPKKDFSFVAKQFEKQSKGKITLAKDIPVQRKNGSVFYADINSTPIILDGKKYLMGIFRDITERKRAEKKLQEQKLDLENKNIAFREVLEQVQIEKDRMKDDIAANVNETLIPILKKLSIKKVPRKYVDLLRYHLEELTSSYARKITEKNIKLTPREIEICNMVKGGLTSKEISQLLNISCQTIDKHRKNIRKKLHISKNNINLSSFLQSI